MNKKLIIVFVPIQCFLVLVSLYLSFTLGSYRSDARKLEQQLGKNCAVAAEAVDGVDQSYTQVNGIIGRVSQQLPRIGDLLKQSGNKMNEWERIYERTKHPIAWKKNIQEPGTPIIKIGDELNNTETFKNYLNSTGPRIHDALNETSSSLREINVIIKKAPYSNLLATASYVVFLLGLICVLNIVVILALCKGEN